MDHLMHVVLRWTLPLRRGPGVSICLTPVNQPTLPPPLPMAPVGDRNTSRLPRPCLFGGADSLSVGRGSRDESLYLSITVRSVVAKDSEKLASQTSGPDQQRVPFQSAHSH